MATYEIEIPDELTTAYRALLVGRHSIASSTAEEMITHEQAMADLYDRAVGIFAKSDLDGLLWNALVCARNYYTTNAEWWADRIPAETTD